MRFAVLMVPQHLWRFPSAKAIASLARRFGLAHTQDMQDWEWEVADVQRIPEFLAVYRSDQLSDDERFVLMEMLIQSFEESDRDLDSDGEWLDLLRILDERVELHIYTIWYWGERDRGVPAEQHFRVTGSVGKILARHKLRFSSVSTG